MHNKYVGVNNVQFWAKDCIYLFPLFQAPSVITFEEDHIFAASRFVISGSLENVTPAHIWYPVGCLSVLPGDIILQTYILSCLLITSESGTWVLSIATTKSMAGYHPELVLSISHYYLWWISVPTSHLVFK